MAGGGFFVPSELSDALHGYMVLYAQCLDARILYGEDAPGFCGVPRTARELANNVAMARIANDLNVPEGIFNKEQIANIFRVPPHLIGWKSKKGVARGKNKDKSQA